MLVNVFCSSTELHFSLNVKPDLSLKEFRALCAKQCKIPTATVKLFHNNKPMEDGKPIKTYFNSENEMIVLEIESSPTRTKELGKPASPHSSTAPTPPIDFSKVKIPKKNSSHGRSFADALSDPLKFKALLLDHPHEIEVVRGIYPPVVNAMLDEDEDQFIMEFYKFCNYIGREQADPHDLPLDVEMQKKIHDQIQRNNIDESMAFAIDQMPESFIEVAMLWINVKVNGHHVKAFVDTGAQMTIMSSNCAKRCELMRLVDRRWEGIAKGVGTQKIVGRIHIAQIQIEKTFLQCSFAILDEQPMDVLFGLDMMRRHHCVIDLKENALIIGSTHTKTHFLPESEQPLIAREQSPVSQRVHPVQPTYFCDQNSLSNKDEDCSVGEMETNEEIKEDSISEE